MMLNTMQSIKLNLCNNNFVNIFNRLDTFENSIHRIFSLNLSLELKEIVSTSSDYLLKKTQKNMMKISHQHCKIEAYYRVLKRHYERIETIETIEIPEKGGFQMNEFILCMFLSMIIGYMIERIRIKIYK